MTVFFRVLDPAVNEKPEALLRAVRVMSAPNRDRDEPSTFEAGPEAFSVVPGSPFAYWVTDEVRRLFGLHLPLESEGRTLSIGASTKNDFRYVRAVWEIPLNAVSLRREDTVGRRWVSFAKGGAFSQNYADVHLVVDWGSDGRADRKSVV